MRVLQIHSRYREYGGEERVVENDAALLREAGHEVLTHEVPNPSGGFGAAASLVASSWNLRQARRVRRLIEDWRPDVAHIHNTWFSLSPSVLKAVKGGGTPLVLTLHNYRLVCASANLWRQGGPCRKCVGRGFAGAGVSHGCYRNSRPLSAAVAYASAIQSAIVRGLPPGRVIVPSEFLRDVLIEGGLREDLFTVMPWTTPDPGQRAKPPSDSGEVYFVGRLEPETKGVERLLASWSRASAAGLLEGLTLNLVGTGPLDGSPDIRKAGIQRHGHLDRAALNRLLLSGRALVVPSLWDEPFGMVAIEAFAAGLPVVSTDRGALPETVGLLGGRCVFAGGDEAAWQAALARLSAPGFVDDRGLAAKRLFRERFHPNLGRERLEQVLMDAAEGKRVEVQSA